MIEVTNGEPLPNDEEAVEVYGMSCGSMDAEFGAESGSQLLMDKAYQIIYGFNKNSSNSLLSSTKAPKRTKIARKKQR